ncbi:TonB-dependent receptor [Ascidiimonas sp. W6]|uniref:TonB-dependent receptor n=1 Tax=Ascidiimonas meishanensis TaxID=3128903 RepID=UPI0030EBB389
MKPTYFLITFLLIGYYTFAQTLRGTVQDEQQFPVEGAYVYNVTSGAHAHTNASGMFVLNNTSPGDSLRIGSLGFKKYSLQLTKTDFSKLLLILLEEKALELNEVVIKNTVNALSTINAIDLKTDPVQSSQEILRKVPGLFIGQHAGGGKAEQIFLRGFDIDHGTDISIEVDGLPVNMVSHAHGQGYSDLHFLIPETIDKIDFGKGPYNANKGNFATAGYVGFQTKERFKKSSISLEVGQFNTLRTLAAFNLLSKGNRQNAYVAMEYVSTDGFFQSSQNFNRINLFAKYSGYLNDTDKLSFSVSNFSSTWDASGQIPERAVASGQISRFGAIDDTEGGTTGRTNINMTYHKIISDNTFVKNQVFYSHYDFELYSNFTFFLNNPEEGDQIRQKENRQIYGFKSELQHRTTFAKHPLVLKIGAGGRFDKMDEVELSETANRTTTLENIQLGDIKENNLYGYVEAKWNLGKVSVIPSLRLDHFKFAYANALANNYQNDAEQQAILSPKLNLLYNPTENLQLFVKSGVGFHSNDARVVTQRLSRNTLPKALGLDVGTIWKPSARVVLNTALWYLSLEDELIYVGDAGIVEPSGRTRRTGIDLGMRYQLSDYLFFDTDAAYAYARSLDAPNGQDYVPLAPNFTWTGGLSLLDYKGFSGGLQYRFLNDRAANEDNSIVAEGYFVTDVNLRYQWKNYALGIAVENLFDTKWKETQFATESRLQEETAAVEEIHFTPGTPFFLKASFSITF